MSDIVYLYGFVPPSTPVPPTSLSGLYGCAVELADAGAARAVFSRVPADELSPATLDAHLDDLNWVGARGLEHERVVAWFVDNGEILPVSLFTLYSSEAALAADAQARAPSLAAHLDRLHMQREWDLKVSWDREKFAARASDEMADVRAVDAEIAAAAAGRRFLLERKRADLVKHGVADAARSAARSLLDRLAHHATDAVALPIARAGEQAVILNAALLVHRSSEEALLEQAARETAALEAAGMYVKVTGPWAPYRFLEARDAAAG